jgi:phosphoenolpyruvate carboxykinase (ATP)
MPTECLGVPSQILNPSNTWQDKNKYEETATKLAHSFIQNFDQYKDAASEEIINGGPNLVLKNSL